MSDDEFDYDRTHSVVKMELTVEFWNDYHSPDEFEMCVGWIASAFDDRDGVRDVSCAIISHMFPNA